MERKNYIIAVDLGSSNVTVAVGEQRDEGLLDAVCVVRRPVEGVKAGKIENIEQVGNAIREAVSEVERQLGIRIAEVYAGISGDFVRCARHTDHVFVYDPQNGVNQRDIDALFDRMRNVQAPDDETIMERVPQNYVVDDNQEVKNPVGSFGKKLSSTFNFILCLKTPLQRLEMAFRRLGIKILNVIPDALATPETLLSEDEKEEGVAVVDVGGGVTDVTVYYRNVVRYIASIPMGASAINRDIRTMGVPERHVESLKLKYGAAVAENAPEDILIQIKGKGRSSRDAKDILLRNLATVVEARATDIAEFVAQELKDSGYAGKLAYGIVLTGGSAQLKDFDELFRRVTGMDVRIARPEAGFTEETRSLVADPACATVAGLLLRGAEQGASSVVVERNATASRTSEPARTTAAAGQNTASGGAVSPAASPARFRPPQPEPVPQFRHVPPRPQPQPDETLPEEETETPAAKPDPYVTEPEPRRKRGLGSIVMSAINKLNNSFSAAEEGDDEEI